MTTLRIGELQTIKTILITAANKADKEAAAYIGADVLAAFGAGIHATLVANASPLPALSQQTRNAIERAEALHELHQHVGVVLDDMLVAADPEGINAPAAHARVHERKIKAS